MSNKKSQTTNINFDTMGRMPPQSQDLEQAVLGALLLEKDALLEVNTIIKPETFYNEQHKYIYQAIVELDSQGVEVDLLTVIDKLRKMEKLDFVGGEFYISELTMKVTSSANIQYYAAILNEKFIARETIRILGQSIANCYTPDLDIFDEVSNIEHGLMLATSSVMQKSVSTSRQVADQIIKDLELAATELVGVPSGYSSLDKITGGFTKGNFILIAARPSVGKSVVACNIAAHLALNINETVAVFTLEMTNKEFGTRIYSARTQIDGYRLRNRRLDDADWLKITAFHGKFGKAPLFIDDTPGISLLELRAKAIRLKQKHGLGMLLIDYVQLMKGNGKSGNREQELSEISKGLKVIAKELDVPVIALAQLSREVEKRSDKTPMLSDLRESGCLTGSVSIYCANLGISKPIKELVGKNDFTVLCTDYENNIEIKPNSCFYSGKKEVFEMVLENGRSIEATANHKFLTLDGWKPLSELLNQYIALPIGTNFQVELDNLYSISKSFKAYNETKTLCYLKVKSITAKGVQDVYDIEVPEHHNFVANGIIVHNSLEQDADMVIFLSRPEMYGMETVNIEGVEYDTHNIGVLNIAKHRNGKVGAIPLRFHPEISLFEDYQNQITYGNYYEPEN